QLLSVIIRHTFSHPGRPSQYNISTTVVITKFGIVSIGGKADATDNGIAKAFFAKEYGIY
ncbi:MAG: hypothetical protein PVG30_01485, partial [Gammaproteobacteria bacterium]